MQIYECSTILSWKDVGFPYSIKKVNGITKASLGNPNPTPKQYPNLYPKPYYIHNPVTFVILVLYWM